jgi:hypothetical protein
VTVYANVLHEREFIPFGLCGEHILTAWNPNTVLTVCSALRRCGLTVSFIHGTNIGIGNRIVVTTLENRPIDGRTFGFAVR